MQLRIEIMKDVILVMKREFRKIIQDRNLLMIFIVAPILYPLLYGAIYINKSEKNVPIAVQDLDNSTLSRSLIREIDAHQNITVIANQIDGNTIPYELSKENIQAVLIIPKEFSKNIKFGREEKVKLIISSGRLLVLSDIGFPISQIVTTFGGKVTASALMKKQIPVLQNKGYAQPIKINFQYLFNPYLTYGDLILPALIIILISQLTFIGSAASQAKEWQLDKWRDLLRTSDNIFSVALGKLLFYTGLFLIFSLIYFCIISQFYGIEFNARILDLLIISLLGITASTTFGLFIGTYFRHRITVFVVLGFTTYPFFMVSGYAWPSEQIPEYLNMFAYCLPLTPFMKSIMSVSQMQNELSSITSYLFISSCQTVLYLILFMLRVNKIKFRREPKSIIARYIEGFPR